jgi:hypothetical protein
MRNWWKQILNYFTGGFNWLSRRDQPKNQDAQSPWFWLPKLQVLSFTRFDSFPSVFPLKREEPILLISNHLSSIWG